MLENQAIRSLREILRSHLGWHGSRLDLLARFILALLQVRTVNLAKVAVILSDRATKDSNYIRLQRFFRDFKFDMELIAKMVAAVLLPSHEAWILTMDRTNWKFGRKEINLLVLGVAYGNISIPLFWVNSCAKRVTPTPRSGSP